MVLKRVAVLSAGKISGLLYAAMGLIVGFLFSVFSLLSAALGSMHGSGEDAFVGLVFGAGAVCFFPVFYGVLGFIVGMITAALYNGIAGAFGGLEIELE